jgi:thioredoxin reductase
MGSIGILGAGPVGLEAALAAAEHGHDAVVYEQAPVVAGHVRSWGHVRMFTPWSMDVSPRMRRALGGAAPDGEALPTAKTVVAVGRRGLLKHEAIGAPERRAAPLRVLLQDAGGAQRIAEHDVVLDCTGTLGHPNRLGDGGIDALGEAQLEDRVLRRIPRPGELAGREVLLSGAGHSAQTAAALLADEPGTRVTWVTRDPDPDFGLLPDDPLPSRAALHRRSHELRAGASPAVEVLPGRTIAALRGTADGRVAVTLDDAHGGREVVVDDVVGLHGGVPDAALYRQLQVHECYASLGPMSLAAALLAAGGGGGDCLAQAPTGPETLRTPEPGFFVLGAKSYGRNSQFLLRIGRQQVDDVFGVLLAAEPQPAAA